LIIADPVQRCGSGMATFRADPSYLINRQFSKEVADAFVNSIYGENVKITKGNAADLMKLCEIVGHSKL
jgi:hypothetical protein